VRKVARDAVARGAVPRRPSLRLIHGEELAAGPPETQAVGPKRTRRASGKPRDLVAVAAAVTGPRPPKLTEALQKASRAIDRGYEQEALRILRPLKDRHPTEADVREMLGVALYRLGRWAPARKELEAFVELTGSAVQHPVLMDCARALGRHTIVERLWEELRAASPAPEVMTEGRIVAAGSLADRGRLPEAIKLLERGPLAPRRIAEHHLRLWYALADLHERAGDIPGARFLFRKVSARDPAFVDVAERLATLS
jgi:tetratricopeptide (TPR) repeat protein